MLDGQSTFLKGIVFALTACLIWGLIFVVPEMMNSFSSFEIALGRYGIYGLISSLLFLKGFKTKKYSKEVWIKAMIFSLTCNIAYYTLIVLALRLASPAIVALVLGVGPVTIAFYGNWKKREVPFRTLILPSILILIGLLIINIPYLQGNSELEEFLLGLLFTLLSLASWTWYVVSNADFLKKHPEVPSNDWATLLGTTTFFWVILLFIGLILFFPEQLNTEQYFVWNEELQNFLVGSAILGICCSWVGTYLWNQASLNIPVSLAGQLTIFETIFGTIYVYVATQTFPSLLELGGIAILLFAVLYGIKKFPTEQELALSRDTVNR